MKTAILICKNKVNALKTAQINSTMYLKRQFLLMIVNAVLLRDTLTISTKLKGKMKNTLKTIFFMISEIMRSGHRKM